MTRHAPALRAGLAAALALGFAAPRAQAADSDAKARFDALLAEAWELDKRESPLLATATGDHRWNDRLASMAPADLERRAAASRSQLAPLPSIHPAPLPPPHPPPHPLPPPPPKMVEPFDSRSPNSKN